MNLSRYLRRNLWMWVSTPVILQVCNVQKFDDYVLTAVCGFGSNAYDKSLLFWEIWSGTIDHFLIRFNFSFISKFGNPSKVKIKSPKQAISELPKPLS